MLALLGVALLLPTIAVAAHGAPAHGAERWALVIGVGTYQGRTKPTFGAGDAVDVRDALRRSGWPDDHIMMLVDGDATAARIREGMAWLVDHSSANSFSVFHYSGHVKQMGGDRDRDGEAVDEYLWPNDNRFISDAEFGRSMRALRGQAWIDFSGCEAAGFDEGINSATRLFTGSSHEPEKSYERPDWNNSVFTGLLVDEGLLQHRADRNGDNRVSLQEAFDHAARMAPEMTSGQKKGPQHPYLAGGDGSEWLLDPPPPPPPPPPAPGGGGRRPVCLPTGCLPL